MARPSRTRAPKTRILLVDDHPIVREGLTQRIAREPDLEVCGEVGTAAEALQFLRTTRPDVAIVDLSLKDRSGLELIRDMHLRGPRVKILVLSMHRASLYAERALRAGARGYVTKDEGVERVIAGIRRLLAGEVFLSEQLSQKILSRLAGAASREVESPASRLTDREVEVLRLTGQGLSVASIARRLHRSVKTIESHRANIKDKLNLRTSEDLLRYAIQWVQSENP